MKIKHIFFTLLLAITFFSGQAQETKFNLLVNEVNSYMLYKGTGEPLNAHRKTYRGLQAGASVDAGITKTFSIVAELYFATKGSVLKEGNPLTTGKSTLRINTLELPVLARVHLGQFYLNAGPYVSWLLGGRIKTDAYTSTPENITKLSFASTTGSFKRWETGLQAGAGYAFKLKKSTLSIDFRYGYGLTSLSSGIARYNRNYVIGVRLQPWKTKQPASKS